MSIPLCKRCEHFKPMTSCLRLSEIELDPVTGERERKSATLMDCYVERSREKIAMIDAHPDYYGTEDIRNPDHCVDACGPNGRFFQPNVKQKFIDKFQKIFNFLTFK